MTICVVFKNGYELKTKCENLEITRNNYTGRVTGLNYKGAIENNPIDIDFNEILCIYRALSDEESDEE